jgi:D-3-phosphoglycerate dehydrogenase
LQFTRWCFPRRARNDQANGSKPGSRELAVALRETKVAGAAIDVFDPEPPPTEYPLLGFDNVLLTPHMAARPHTAVEKMSWVVRDVVDVLTGRPATYPAP